MIESVNTNGAKLLDFDSWGDWLEYCKQNLPSNHYNDASEKNDSEFTGTPNYSAALSLAVSGWEEKVSEARVLSEGLINKVLDKIATPVIHYDVEGIDFDMARVHRGEPEVWYRFEEHIIENDGDNVVRIVINNIASCGISTESIIRRGAVIAALVELLEYSHKKVEIISHTPFHTGKIEFRTIVKTANQPLDMARLMFMSGHPSMLRRLLFRALELNPKEHRECGMSYGMPHDLQQCDWGDVYFGKMHYEQNEQWYKNPEQFIIDQLTKQGIEVKQA
jgi:hypothetical protein